MSTVKVDATLSPTDNISWHSASGHAITLLMGQDIFITISPKQAERIQEVLKEVLRLPVLRGKENANG